VSTHVVPPSGAGHAVCVCWHDVPPLHFPAVHVCPLEHALPQEPQFLESVCVFAQIALPPSGVQSVPELQLEPHVPFEQTCDALHAWPHAPQLSGSLVSTAHVAPHIVPAQVPPSSPAGSAFAHAATTTSASTRRSDFTRSD